MYTAKLSPSDLLSLELLETPKLAPDGKEVVLIHKTFNAEKNEYDSFLCAIPSGSSTDKIEFLSDSPLDAHPLFSPDGTSIAFIRNVNGFGQIFEMERSSKAVRQLTNFKNHILEFAWSPDGKMIAFTALANDQNLLSADKDNPADLYRKYTQGVKVIHRIQYKFDDFGIIHDKRKQIYLLDLESKKIVQLTFGEHDGHNPQFSSDGKFIVFSSNRNTESDYQMIQHIYLIPVNGGNPKNLTPGDVCFKNPIFSPDGKLIACIGIGDANDWYATPRLWIVPVEGEKYACLTDEASFCVGNQAIDDLRPFSWGGAPVWSHDSRKLFVSASDSGKTYLISVELESKRIKKFAEGNHVIYNWDVKTEFQQAVVGLSNPQTPNDLWSLNMNSGVLSRLTRTNIELSQKFSFSEPEAFIAKSHDGTPIEFWMLKPPGFDPNLKYPAILEIHGGPMAMYAWTFFYEFQMLANQGFIVVYSNPRGSLGYGEKFTREVKWNWSKIDCDDLTAVLEKALQNRFIDQKRLGVAGGSYGGFLTCHIISRTNQFSAAIAMRSIVNEYSRFGTSHYGFLGYLAGNDPNRLPWTNPESFLSVSPIAYVEGMKTPLLIMHSEEDYLCPIEQAEQLFTALKMLRRDVEFVRFPGESHELSTAGKPWHRVFRLEKILNWFQKYLKKSI